jgi:hypothetical protein
MINNSLGVKKFFYMLRKKTKKKKWLFVFGKNQVSMLGGASSLIWGVSPIL